jgi:uncharacterized protein (TIGR03382 family)
MRIIHVAALAAVSLLVLGSTAHAVERSCPKGQIWDINRGACRKIGGGGKGKTKKYEEGMSHIEGRAKNADPAKGVKLVGEACKGKLAEACTTLGYVYLNGRGGVTKDAAKALEYYEKGCDLKDADGCIGAYEVNAYGYLVVGSYDYAKGLPYLTKGCDKLKSGRACRRLAQLYDWGGTGVTVDKDKATKLYASSFPMLESDCKDGDGESCWEIGYMYLYAYGAPFDLDKAVSLFDKGCQNASGNACYYAAGLMDPSPDSYYTYIQGREKLVDKTYAKSYALYEKACNRFDHFDSCYQAGRMLADGRVTGDTSAVEKMARRVCDLSAYSCNLWASLKDDGKLVTQDKPGALQLYEKACEAGNSLSCTTAAERYGNYSDYGTYNPAKAVKLWEKACEMWDAASCTRAAQQYYWGDSYNNIVQDYAKSFSLFSTGCNRGDYSACSWAGDMLANGNDGTGVKKVKESLEYYGYSCNSGYGYSCYVIAEKYADGTATGMGVKDLATAATYYQSGCFAYTYFDWTSCTKVVEGRRTGSAEVPKDLVLAGRAQAQICKNGGGVADCLLADKLLKEGAADQYTKDEVLYSLDSGCTLGYESACVALAILYRDGGYLVMKNVTDSFRRLGESCARYSMEACYQLGVSYEKGLGTEKSADQARLQYQAACSGYIQDACIALARVAGDPKEQLEQYKALCNGQQMAAGCSGAATMYATGSAGRWDVTEAYDLYTKGCDLADGPSCGAQAWMLELGIGTEARPGKAFELYQKSCDAGYAAACGGAARFLATGKNGVTADEGLADKLFAQACDADSAEACRWYADFLTASKKGTAPQIAKLYQKAMGIAKEQAKSTAQGKWLLGSFHLAGVATVKSPDEAVALFVKSCDENYVIGCLDAGRMYLAEPGYEGIKRDPAIAKVTLDKACAASLNEACTLAAKAASGGPGVVGPKAKGCCDTGGGPSGAIPGLLVLALVLRRRRRAV